MVYLFTKHLLGPKFKQEFQQESSQAKKAEKLLDEVLLGDKYMFDAFVQALRRTKQDHLANLLDPKRPSIIIGNRHLRLQPQGSLDSSYQELPPSQQPVGPMGNFLDVSQCRESEFPRRNDYEEIKYDGQNVVVVATPDRKNQGPIFKSTVMVNENLQQVSEQQNRLYKTDIPRSRNQLREKENTYEMQQSPDNMQRRNDNNKFLSYYNGNPSAEPFEGFSKFDARRRLASAPNVYQGSIDLENDPDETAVMGVKESTSNGIKTELASDVGHDTYVKQIFNSSIKANESISKFLRQKYLQENIIQNSKQREEAGCCIGDIAKPAVSEGEQKPAAKSDDEGKSGVASVPSWEKALENEKEPWRYTYEKRFEQDLANVKDGNKENCPPKWPEVADDFKTSKKKQIPPPISPKKPHYKMQKRSISAIVI